jgi:hypothetical protein
MISLILGALALTAIAQTRGTLNELTFNVLSAQVQKFDPPVQSRNGRYDAALVLRLDASVADSDSLPPDSAPFLYIGTHELIPIASDYERGRVVFTFHDPNWQQLKGGEPMVLTTLHGDPINNPDRYKGYPRFDPSIITP